MERSFWRKRWEIMHIATVKQSEASEAPKHFVPQASIRSNPRGRLKNANANYPTPWLRFPARKAGPMLSRHEFEEARRGAAKS
jgi:hypothetical protein